MNTLRKLQILFAALLLSAFSFLSCDLYFEPEEITFNGKVYNKTFHDDFNNFNSWRWERCPEWERQDLHGVWKNSCSFTENGCLVIKAEKSGDKLFSGAVRTFRKFSQNKGLFQIRFMVPHKTQGLWYAFWLMSTTVDKVGNGAVDGGEIDIMELLPCNPYDAAHPGPYINSAVHWDGYGDYHDSEGSQYFLDDSFYNQWHTITFEWTESSYKAYLDDNEEPYWCVEGDDVNNYGGIVNTANYLKVTAEFGNWAGSVDQDALPAQMYVDWIKVFE